MKWTPLDIKAAFAIELQKNGHSLEDLETALRKKPASFEKEAFEKVALPSFDVLGAIKSLASGVGAGAAGLGALGGATAYAGYKANENSDDKIMKKMQEVQQYQRAMQSLQSAMRDNQLGM